MVGRGAEAASEDEPRFRIRVCMRRYFADERARCLLLVGARRRVRWLARRLRALFPLPPRVALLCRGHLLPSGEPLALLDPDDLVEVVPRRAVRECVGIADAPEDAEGDCVDSRVSSIDKERANIEDGDESKAGTEDAVESVDRDSEMAYVPRFPADEPDESDELHDSKRLALAALEQYCVSIPTAAVAALPRARRRRVRRRRRPMVWEPHAPSAELVGEPGAKQELLGPGGERLGAEGEKPVPGGERLGAEEEKPVRGGERLGAGGERLGAEEEKPVPGGERLGAGGERLVAEEEKPVAGEGRPRAPRVVRALPAGTPPTCNDIDVIYRCDNGFLIK